MCITLGWSTHVHNIRVVMTIPDVTLRLAAAPFTLPHRGIMLTWYCSMTGSGKSTVSAVAMTMLEYTDLPTCETSTWYAWYWEAGLRVGPSHTTWSEVLLMLARRLPTVGGIPVGGGVGWVRGVG